MIHQRRKTNNSVRNQENEIRQLHICVTHCHSDKKWKSPFGKKLG